MSSKSGQTTKNPSEDADIFSGVLVLNPGMNLVASRRQCLIKERTDPRIPVLVIVAGVSYCPRMAANTMLEVTVPMPTRLATLRFPKALDARLHYLLDEQSRRGHLSAAERREAEALANIATTLSILKLGAQVKAL